MPRLIAAHLPAGSLNHRAQPVLRAKGYMLRPWAKADADALLAAFADPEIRLWNAQSLESRPEAVAMIALFNRGWLAETSAHWAVADAVGAEPVGRVAIREIDLDAGTGELAYWVAAPARGRGIATAAALAAAEWALTDVGLYRLVLHHAVENTGSCGVAERAGFALEGTLRRAALHPGGRHDVHLHARLREGA
jgi:RimJ/RimL family protein N-acetyltransferase